MLRNVVVYFFTHGIILRRNKQASEQNKAHMSNIRVIHGTFTGEPCKYDNKKINKTGPKKNKINVLVAGLLLSVLSDTFIFS